VKKIVLLPLAAILIASPVWASSNSASTLTFSAAALSFNGSSNNVSSQPITVTVTGSQPVTITSATFSNGNFFSIPVSLPLTLPGGQSFTGQISARPQSTPQTGKLTFVTNVGTYTVSLTETAAQATSSSHEVALVWQKPTTGGNVVAYDVDRAPAGGTSFTEIGSTGGGTRNWTDSSVQNGKSYVYRVRSVGDEGDTSNPSNTVTLTIP
jgi:hypothetical protein